MPVYECVTQQGTLTPAQREHIARETTRIHSEETGAPEPFIHVVFNEYPEGYAFSSNAPGSPVVIRGNIRAGRPESVRRSILQRINDLWLEATDVPQHHILVAVFDFMPSWAMEGGMMLPPTDPDAEAAWLADLESSRA